MPGTPAFDVAVVGAGMGSAPHLRSLQDLRAIPRAALSEADQLHYDTFEWQQQLAVSRQHFREYLQPISHQGGVIAG